MPWTLWQKVEFNAHSHFGTAAPSVGDLREWLTSRDGGGFIMQEERCLDPLVNLILATWSGFEALEEPRQRKP
jgi:hypothetical protein